MNKLSFIAAYSYFCLISITLQWRHNERDATQITGVSTAYLTGCSGADQWKHQSCASLAFVRGIHRGPVNSPHKGPVTWKMFPFDDVIMNGQRHTLVILWVSVYSYISIKVHVLSCQNVYCFYDWHFANKEQSSMTLWDTWLYFLTVLIERAPNQ